MAMTKRERRITRREFVGGALAAAGAVAGAPALLRGQNLNNKLNIAMIGAAGRGLANMKGVASENITVLCDVDTVSLDKIGTQHPQAKRYADFRKVFDRPGDFDAVVVSTCEHTHAFATMLALKAGKHVYCEKPLTYNISEARLIRETASKLNLATQMGNQGHASDNHRRVKELMQAGVIGPVREVHVWVNRAWGLQSQDAATRNKDILFVTELPKAEPVPPGLEWDLWLGPAPARPFNSMYVPGPKWYRWWDFGNGTMSDLGSHDNDVPFTVLDIRQPLTIEASSPHGPAHKELAPATMTVTYEFPASASGAPPVKLVWHQGNSKPPGWVASWGNRSQVFIGEKGMLLGSGRLLPEERFQDFQAPPETLPRSPGHWVEWVNYAKGAGPVPGSNFQYAGWTTEANHLGNVAYRTGKKIEWDYQNLRARNAPEAAPFIKRPAYRKGWDDILKT